MSSRAKSIGIIMDGNRRFAKTLGLATSEGHKNGFEKLKEVLRWCKDENIEHIVAYCFSTENWRREKDEVDSLLSLFRIAFEELEKDVYDSFTFKVIGNKNDFPKDIQEIIESINKRERRGAANVYLALSYGGKDEIVRAVESIIKSKGEISEEGIEKSLDTYPMPLLDLIIRTGGAKRLSNFLLWQGAYAELFFVDTFWPAFTKEEFIGILNEYENRKRNFGA